MTFKEALKKTLNENRSWTKNGLTAFCVFIFILATESLIQDKVNWYFLAAWTIGSFFVYMVLDAHRLYRSERKKIYGGEENSN